MDEAAEPVRPVERVVLLLVGFVVTPFLVTGLARLTYAYPYAPVTFDFALVGLATVVLYVKVPRARPACIGSALALIAYAVFFLWLFTAMS